MKRAILLLASFMLVTLIAAETPLTAQVASAPQFVNTGQRFLFGQTNAVALGDLTGDGFVDAFTVNNSDSRIFTNDQGSGQFLAAPTTRSPGAETVALGDLDDDGDLDAFGGLRGANVIWLNGSAPADFMINSGQQLGNRDSRGIALGDLDDDGDLDAFVANAEYRASGQPDLPPGNTVWLNDGSGIFTDSGQDLGMGNSLALALGDLDDDGDLDAFVANGLQNNTADQVWLNDGSGNFSDSGQELSFAWNTDIALGDVDGDTDLDALVGSYTANASLWLNDGSGNFSDSGQSLIPADAVALGDLDNDGDLEAVLADFSATPMQVWLNDGSGTFSDSGLRLGEEFSTDLALAEIAQGGGLDIFEAGATNNFVWLNQTPVRPQPAPAGVPGWQRDIAASAGNAGNHLDIAIDSRGRPHFSHFEENQQTINYAHWDGIRWYRETVAETSSFNAETLIALDQQDQPQLLYRTGISEWNYIRRSGEQWQPVATLEAQTVADMLVDTNGRLVVAYENDSSKLSVARRLGDAWQSSEIDSRLLDEVQAALLAGAGDELHLAYVADNPWEIVYARFDGSTWNGELVSEASTFATFAQIDLARNGNGQLVILYTVADSTEQLLLATNDGVSWNSAQIFATGTANITKPSLAYDSQGQAHVLFLINNRPYYDKATGGWEFAALPGDESVTDLSELTMGANDIPQFGFRDAAYANLNYQFFGPAWEIHTLEASDSARLPAISHVRSDVAVAFYSLNQQQLRFFARGMGTWRDNPVADLTLPGADSSLRLDLRGRHAISYRDPVNDRLMYARIDGSTWQREIVDDFADVGYENTLLVGENNRVIVYWDATNSRVKLAWNDGSGWTLFANDSGPPQNSSSGRPRVVWHGGTVYVVYYDGVAQDLRLATFDLFDPGWNDTLLVENVEPYVEADHDLALVDGPALRLVYHNNANDQIVLGSRRIGAADWEFEVVAADLERIRGLELAAKSYAQDNALQLVYLDSLSNSVVRASRSGDAWQFETVRDGDAFLAEPALALGERPYLAYAAIGTPALELAVRVPGALQRGIRYNPYNPGDNGDNSNFLTDVCAALLNPDETVQSISSLQQIGLPPGSEYATFAAMTDVFLATPEGERYTELYVQHQAEMLSIGAADPQLLWDSYQTLQDFMPGLAAMVSGQGSEVLVSQRMVDNALSVWQRMAAAASPELAQAINSELAQSNNLQDFVGLSFDEWALEIGVQPPGTRGVLLPLVRAP